jgi:hypothetical protein
MASQPSAGSDSIFAMNTSTQNQSTNTANNGAFVSTIGALKAGSLNTMLDDAMRQVSEAVAKTQLTGSLSLALEIKPAGFGVDGETPLYKIVPKITTKVPSVPEKAKPSSLTRTTTSRNATRTRRV